VRIEVFTLLLAISACGGDPAVTSDAGLGGPDAAMPDGGGGVRGLHTIMGSGGTPGHLVDGNGNVVRLHGVNRSGTEYACIQNDGIFDGPSDQASIDAMKTWKVNAVRVPLNEDCWLDINGVQAAYGGSHYQKAITDYVNLLVDNGMIVILDLHWAAPGNWAANEQLAMADADHAPTFWAQVAAAFADKADSVIFDLFNEPFITDWTCWVRGGTCAQDHAGASYQTAGMASLIQAVRSTGAQNVIILGGLDYSRDFSQWVDSVNSIPSEGVSIANVMASWHAYDFNAGSYPNQCPSEYNGYSTSVHCPTGQATAANDSITSVLAAGFPVLAGETGLSADAASTPFSAAQVTDLTTWYESLLTWLDGQEQGYLGWEWNTSGGPLLITDYAGTPTPAFGVTYKAHLQQF
jgi:hypothetical protein